MPAISLNTDFFNHDAQVKFSPSTHIDSGLDIDGLIKSGSNILIQGIRGTGITHILKMVQSISLSTYIENKVLPIYFSLGRLTWLVDEPIGIYRVHLYANIINEAISIIEEYKNIIKPAKLDKDEKEPINSIQSMFGLKTSNDINVILREIKSIHNELISDFTSIAKSVKNMEYKTNQSQANVELNLLKTIKASIKGKGGIYQKQEIDTLIDNLLYHNPANLLYKFFDQVKKIMGIRNIILLLDECNIGDHEKQLEIFELLKIIRSGTHNSKCGNYIYFWASFYPPFATNFPALSKGDKFDFHAGHDARSEYLQLNELAGYYTTFFSELTRKRLEQNFDKTIENPIDEAFESEEAFLLAAYCSNGIPRRYLEILMQSHEDLRSRSRNKPGPTQKISLSDVHGSVNLIASQQVRAPGNLSKLDEELLDKIIHMLLVNNRDSNQATVYFTINRSQIDRFKNLLIYGCIHDTGLTRYKTHMSMLGAQGPLYMLDLSIAYQSGVITKDRFIDTFKRDLRDILKRGELNHFVIPYNVTGE